jgi:hypothetical protein
VSPAAAESGSRASKSGGCVAKMIKAVDQTPAIRNPRFDDMV